MAAKRTTAPMPTQKPMLLLRENEAKQTPRIVSTWASNSKGLDHLPISQLTVVSVGGKWRNWRIGGGHLRKLGVKYYVRRSLLPYRESWFISSVYDQNSCRS